jgi:hypothetical protein
MYTGGAYRPSAPIYLAQGTCVDTLPMSQNNPRTAANAVFRVGELADSALIAWTLQPMEMVLCAAPAYIDTHGLTDDAG